ncbi:MAG: ribosomal-processing cysteine protease Prp [Oscillospiraceae bacterium]|nr:ribosomal-processing cysteine protease Prp [Oscillospiraceae bacterium]
MIYAEFLYSGKICIGFKMKGHALFGEFGSDIVCSAVSSAVQMCCNGITEVAGAKADVSVSSDGISLETEDKSDAVQAILSSLKLQLDLLSNDYSDNISLSILEV